MEKRACSRHSRYDRYTVHTVRQLLEQLLHSRNFYKSGRLLHCVPKLVTPLLQMHLIEFEINGFQRNIVHCTFLILLTYYDVCTLPCVLTVTFYIQVT